MSLYTFFGCLFLAYGPILSIFFLYIARNAQYVLLMVTSAFFCLIALLISSVIWYLAKKTQSTHAVTIAYSIAIQEIFRWIFFRILSRAETGLNLVSKNPTSPFNRPVFGFVSGFGYALMTCLVSYISLLVESLGPGVRMCQSCPGLSLFFVSAINTTVFSLLHMAWMMVAFEGFSSYKTKTGMLQIAWVIISHYGASYATLFNASDIHLGCVYSALIGVVILALSCGWIAHGLKTRNHIGRHTN
ncbi:gamma-secretase subunit Aph-1 [Phycomyces nitens]|nr:gamma-secretase subunit Aph-1 [Phycomyces nitens]